METVLLHKSAFLYVTSIFRLSSFVFANALLTGITKTFVPFYSSFPEIFPNTIRSTVMSIAVAGQWIANFLVSWTFPMLDKNQYLTDTFNHGMAYWVYGVMGVLAALFIWKFVPETKGRTLEQMEQYWK